MIDDPRFQFCAIDFSAYRFGDGPEARRIAPPSDSSSKVRWVTATE